MATGTMGTNAREHHLQHVHYLRKSISFDTPGIASGVKMPQPLPSGSIVLRTTVLISTVFDAGTTNVLTVGTNSSRDNLVGSSALNEAATGLTAVANTAVAAMAADTEVYVKYEQTGTAATAGAATVIIEYVPNNDG